MDELMDIAESMHKPDEAWRMLVLALNFCHELVEQGIKANDSKLESQDFYEMCQQYRHSTMGATEFEALKQWIKAA
jgi:hypothetical protein